ncbi:MAG: glycosyl hydrolase [Chloroflexota bacterium]
MINSFSRIPVSISALIRLALFALLIYWIQPAPDLVILGEPQTVVSEYPKLSVHTRLADEVEEWKIKRSLEMVREMGATSIVEFFPWAYYHSSNGEIAWSHPDKIIDHAHQQGLQVIARLGFTPDWARPEDTPLNYLDEEGFIHFADFAARFAERYAGKVTHIIVWNEPNLAFEWGFQEASPETYVALMAETYRAVKAVNPDVIILGGALAPTLEPKGSPNGLNDLIFLEEMYQAGAANYMDGLAVHTYGFKFPPDFEPAPDVLNFRRLELLREIMVNYGDETSKIYITEMGWNDHPRWTRAVRPGQRITYTTDAIRYLHGLDYVETAAIWMFRTPAPIKSYMDYFTLVTPEFIEKPIYQALQEMTGNAEQ